MFSKCGIPATNLGNIADGMRSLNAPIAPATCATGTQKHATSALPFSAVAAWPTTSPITHCPLKSSAWIDSANAPDFLLYSL